MVDITKFSVQDRINRAYKASLKDSTATTKRVCIENLSTDPVPVEIVDDGVGSNIQNVYGSVSAVATLTLTTVVTYTVGVGKTFYLKEVEASGSNRAKYTIEFNSVVNRTKRTYQPIFNANFNFHNLKFVAGDVIRLRVFHNRGSAGDFEGAIVGNEI